MILKMERKFFPPCSVKLNRAEKAKASISPIPATKCDQINICYNYEFASL